MRVNFTRGLAGNRHPAVSYKTKSKCIYIYMRKGLQLEETTERKAVCGECKE